MPVFHAGPSFLFRYFNYIIRFSVLSTLPASILKMYTINSIFYLLFFFFSREKKREKKQKKKKSEMVGWNNKYDALARLPNLAREAGQICFLAE